MIGLKLPSNDMKLSCHVFPQHMQTPWCLHIHEFISLRVTCKLFSYYLWTYIHRPPFSIRFSTIPI